jgi:hypothetical protein
MILVGYGNGLLCERVIVGYGRGYFCGTVRFGNV